MLLITNEDHLGYDPPFLDEHRLKARGADDLIVHLEWDNTPWMVAIMIGHLVPLHETLTYSDLIHCWSPR